MSPQLSVGKWRGLVSTSTPQHVFDIVAFDQRGNYERMLPEGTAFSHKALIKQQVATALSPHTSAMLLDATYGLGAVVHLHRNSGLLLALEKTGYTGSPTHRLTDFDPAWTIEKIKKAGADAVKMLIYYHPDSGALAEEIEALVTEIAQGCRQYDIAFFLEPLAYSIDENVPQDSGEFAQQMPHIVRETARKLGPLVDILKLEFPIKATYDPDEKHWQRACEAISEVSPVPWVLLSAGVNFEVFERQVRIACRAGASGFLGGRAVWKEAVTMTEHDRQTFLQNTARARVERLSAITAAHARPWSEFYQPPATPENWFEDYP